MFARNLHVELSSEAENLIQGYYLASRRVRRDSIHGSTLSASALKILYVLLSIFKEKFDNLLRSLINKNLHKTHVLKSSSITNLIYYLQMPFILYIDTVKRNPCSNNFARQKNPKHSYLQNMYHY